MDRTSVSSSNLASVGFDPDSGILEIEFQNGGVYQYFGVPEDTHNSLMNAGSHGQYFQAHIRGSFQYSKV